MPDPLQLESWVINASSVGVQSGYLCLILWSSDLGLSMPDSLEMKPVVINA